MLSTHLLSLSLSYRFSLPLVGNFTILLHSVRLLRVNFDPIIATLALLSTHLLSLSLSYRFSLPLVGNFTILLHSVQLLRVNFDPIIATLEALLHMGKSFS